MTDEEKHIFEQYFDETAPDRKSIPGAGIVWCAVIGAVTWAAIFALVKWWP